MQSSPASEIARSPDAWERIAKDWLVELIERTPLDEVEALPVGWLAREAPPLIAEILGQLSDPGLDRELVLPPSARERAAALAAQTLDASRVPVELAALQALLIDAIGRESREHDRGGFARTAARLAEVFGALQSAALEGLAKPGSAGTVRDQAADPAPAEIPEAFESGRPVAPAAGPEPVAPPAPIEPALPGPAELHQWLRIMIAESRPNARPFAVAHVEIEGMERIKAAYGPEAAESIALAVAGIAEAQLSAPGRVFRRDESQLVILREGRDAGELAGPAARLCSTVEDSQTESGGRVSVSVGLASFPANGDSPGPLLDAAEEAAWAAAAGGDAFSLAAGSLQDP